jgi:hypothetical protein
MSRPNAEAAFKLLKRGFVPTETAASHCGVHRITVWKWAQAERVRSCLHGRFLFVRLSDCEKAIKGGKR